MSRLGESEQEGVRTLLHGWEHWKQKSQLQKVTCRSGLALTVKNVRTTFLSNRYSLREPSTEKLDAWWRWPYISTRDPG
eukprot:4280752-Heterocapsa_arctica.AAC.1